MIVLVNNVRLQSYEGPGGHLGTEVLVTFCEVGDPRERHALSRYNWSVPNNRASVEQQREAFLRRAERW